MLGIGKKIANLLLAVAIVSLFCVAAAQTVSAQDIYANGPVCVQFPDGSRHEGLGYNIPHNAPARPSYIGGVDTSYWMRVYLGQHSDPQKWDFYGRQQISSTQDSIILLVPTRYTYVKPNYAREIYLRY